MKSRGIRHALRWRFGALGSSAILLNEAAYGPGYLGRARRRDAAFFIDVLPLLFIDSQVLACFCN
jgi:hypothetical protein